VQNFLLGAGDLQNGHMKDWEGFLEDDIKMDNRELRREDGS
jgi:hypothetical protein